MSQGSIPPKVTDNAVAVWSMQIKINMVISIAMLKDCFLVCVSQMGPNCISKIEGRYGSEQFCFMMKNNIVPILKKEAERVFIMDRFPVHICSVVRQWFNEQNGISLSLLPGKSGDFNPVAKVGEALVKHLNSHPVDVKTVEELWSAVSNEFKKICTPSFIQNALVEMREVMNNVCDS